MPATLALRRAFVADHFHDLPGFQEDRHGHNWEVEACVELVQDADEARFQEALEGWIGAVDYRLLNELPALAGRNPTAELLAAWAFQDLLDAGLVPRWVRMREKANYWARCAASAEA
jgi:6-pyruvoyl-tetrahydropterin synthase